MTKAARDQYNTAFFEAAPNGLPNFEKPRIGTARSIFVNPEGRIDDLLHGQVLPLRANGKSGFLNIVSEHINQVLAEAQEISAILAGEATPDRYGHNTKSMRRAVASALYPPKERRGKLTQLSAELLTVEEVEVVQVGLSTKLTGTHANELIAGSEIYLAFAGQIKSSIGNTIGRVGCAAAMFHTQPTEQPESGINPIITVSRIDSIDTMEKALHSLSIGAALAQERINLQNPYRGGTARPS